MTVTPARQTHLAIRPAGGPIGETRLSTSSALTNSCWYLQFLILPRLRVQGIRGASQARRCLAATWAETARQAAMASKYAGDDDDNAMVGSSTLIPNWANVSFSEIVVGDRIGGGGVGVIYSGQWRSKPVALKTLFDPRISNDLKQEFMDELLVMSKVEHSNIVKFLGACVTPPNLCFIMELCDTSLFHMLHVEKCAFSLEESLQAAVRPCLFSACISRTARLALCIALFPSSSPSLYSSLPFPRLSAARDLTVFYWGDSFRLMSPAPWSICTRFRQQSFTATSRPTMSCGHSRASTSCATLAW